MSKEEKLFLDLWDYDDPAYPFQIFVGAYGAGKSFSGLKGAIEREIPWMYMRRTKDAFDACCCGPRGGEGNPFNPLNDTLGWDIGIHKINQKMGGIYHQVYDEKSGIPKPEGAPIGTATYLPALAKVRGAGLEKTELIFYDEFIKELHEPKMRGEFRALMRGYETINRNKEFRGLPPSRLWLVSNAEDIYNEVFIGLGIVSDCEKMSRKGQEHKYYPQRRLAVHLLHSSEAFLEKKRKTALMQLMEGTQFADVGLNNQFANNDFSLVGYKRLAGYFPVCALSKAFIYRKKGENLYYVSYAPAKCAQFNGELPQDERFFRQRHALALQDAFTHGQLEFESYELKSYILEHIF